MLYLLYRMKNHRFLKRMILYHFLLLFLHQVHHYRQVIAVAVKPSAAAHALAAAADRLVVVRRTRIDHLAFGAVAI